MEKRRFFYDTEFIERPGHLDLISIAFVSEDGNRELYCISGEFDARQATPWVVANVLSRLPLEPDTWGDGPWMRRARIAESILSFLKPSKEDKVELWGYYPAYDHVALCWLFGPMVDLPPGMPMLTKCVKQLCDWVGNPELPPQPADAHNALEDAHWTRNAWQFLMQREDFRRF